MNGFQLNLKKLAYLENVILRDDKVLTMYANDKGKHGTENKTELPPPLETQLYFGDIFVIAHKDNKIVDLSLEEYSEFYNSAFGGFEDLDKEESLSEEEEPNSEDEAFIVNDIDDGDSDYVVESDEEDTDSISDNTNEELELEKWNKMKNILMQLTLNYLMLLIDLKRFYIIYLFLKMNYLNG